MKKNLLILLKIVATIYVLVCIGLYFYQEKLIFFPEKLAKNYKFDFPEKFEELKFHADDGKLLSGVLFKADSSKGLVFYLHGNGGSIKGWGDIADRKSTRLNSSHRH